MHFSSSLSLLACAALSGSGLVSAAPHMRRGVVCYFEVKALSGETCESMAASWGITAAEFVLINPGVPCPNLEAGKSYCVIGEYTPDPPGSSTTTTSGPTSTSTRSMTTTATTPGATGTPDPGNTPQMPGIIATCNKFYKIVSGDTCDRVAQKNGVTVAQFRSWNSEINASCSNLWLDYYVCVGAPGGGGNGPNTPQLPGAAPNCEKWHKIATGDTCDNIAYRNTITVNQLRTFNTGINSNCNNLLRDYFACVAVPGMATPMPDIVSGCTRYYQVVSGDGCDVIASKQGITTANFRRWNPFINSACTNLWLDALVCTAGP